MSYLIELDNFGRDDWESSARLFTDYNVYQTWPYQEYRCRVDGQKMASLIVRSDTGEVALMAQIRIQQAPLLPFRVGYILNGPLIRREGLIPVDIAGLFHAMTTALFDAGIHVLRIVPNVVADEQGLAIEQELLGAGFRKLDNKKPYHTFKVDVTDSEPAIRQRLSKSYKRNLKKAEKAGLTVQSGTDEKIFDILASLYKESKARKGFKGLAIEEFSIPQKHLSADEKMKVFVASNAGQPISALLSAELGDSANVLLAASNAIGLKMNSSELLWYRACISAHERRLKWCDLGGVDPDGNASVYEFKARLGGKEVHHIGIYDSYKNRSARLFMALVSRIKS